MGKGVLKNSGRLSMKEAENKANKEFLEYKKCGDKKFVSDFDRVIKKLGKLN